MKVSPFSLVEIYKRFEQPAAAVFEEDVAAAGSCVSVDWLLWLPHLCSFADVKPS
jgi:hypothetical protein